METVRIFIWLAGLVLLSTTQSGIIKECSDGWTQVQRTCFKFVERKLGRYYANKVCEGQDSVLAVIKNKEENKVVQDLIRGRDDAWIGLQYSFGEYYWNNIPTDQFDFFNMAFSSSRGDRCTVMLPGTGRWRKVYCSTKRPYVCGKRVGCESGWVGDECDRQCHCYLGHVCNEITKKCPYGCEPGWTGDTCDKYLEKPTVESFYCMKQRGGYSMMVSMDLKGISFSNVGAMNAEGDITSNCNMNRFESKGDGLTYLNIQIQNVSGTLEPDCPANTLGDGILQWTFRFQLTEGRVSFEDAELHVQCDLSETDAAYDESKSVEIEEIRGKYVFDVSRTPVNVQTYIANPETLKPATNLSLGEPVRLVATLTEEHDVVTPLFTPSNCQASSPDGKVAVALKALDGCPLSWRLGENEHLILTDIFRMFCLPGYTEVVFSCTFTPCLYDPSHCSERCYRYYG
ncbi:uncharacterized protein LOC124261974 [Haliotis rubra]|uniref:uncharacterized protein LOC124261974 n=1 Tax=Haliotis rubra TaxID=36100 RepID=UPI001EE5445C|nr:uncharacterized protein LOC124261974 [Haliotis rubra]